MPATAPPPVRPSSATRAPRRFTVEEYHAMAEAGILGEDDRVELIEGQILAMSPIGSRHINCVMRLNRLLVERSGSEIGISVQSPVRMDDGSEPEPDFAVLKPRDDYAERVPRSEDVLLVIEVADTSLAADRTLKVPLYARHGIPEVWLVALEEDYVEVYRRPSSDGYGEMRRHERGDTLTATALSDASFSIDDVLG